MEKIFNKLVRDKIPEIIQQDGKIAVTRILNDNEYKIELMKKLLEECNEVLNSSDSSSLIEELADVLEVIRSIALNENCSFSELLEIAKEKENDRGGFNKRIYLIKTITKEVENG